MSLQAGQKLAHYEILEPIGKGGMGEVYRAKDQKLGRDVAIKVLPDEFARDEERLRRFRREAKVLAALNHPNIASIYGLEQSEDTHYLVLELVPGETLAERISRGPISVDEALEIADKIAEALEVAHEQGIIHRDLKPANIKITPDDKIKVLDYGLAKAFVDEQPDADSSMSPTMTRDATRVGVILGTAAYMSPEQAKGKRVDKRADIWAFGVVLYEMLTGSRAFAGEDVSDTLAYVLTKEPDWDALPTDLSPTLRTYLNLCFEKDPKRRVRDIGDVRLAIDGAFDVGASGSASAGATRPKMWLGVLVLSAVMGGLAVWSLTSGPTPPGDPVRFTVAMKELATRRGGALVRISPDGTRLVATGVTNDQSDSQLYLRSFDQLDTVPIRGTLGARNPAISRDGEWVAFNATNNRRTLMKVPVAGGPPTVVAELPGAGRGMSWDVDGRLLVAVGGMGLFEVSGDGGEPEPVTVVDADRHELGHIQPSVIPGRRAALFAIGISDNVEIAAVDLDTREVTRLGLAGVKPHYAATGHLVYMSVDSVLRAVAFDPDRLAVTGSPVSLVVDVRTFSLSDTGRLVYVPGGTGGSRTLVWVDRTGREESFEPPLAPGSYVYPRVAPDGTRLVIADVEGPGAADLWVIDLARGARSRVTFGGNNQFFPTWTPEGARLTFADGNGVVNRVMVAPADGSGSIDTLLERSERQFPTSWASDGRTLAYYVDHPDTGRDIWTLPADGDGTPEPFLVTPFQERVPTFSPDGRWLAYVSDKSGRDEVYVRPYPTTTPQEYTVSTRGGQGPVWSPDGRELFFAEGEAIMAVAVETDGGFRAGVPEMLFEGYVTDPSTVSGIANYDITPDGRRFVMVKRLQDAADSGEGQIVVVLNWFDELERRVPTDN